MKFSLLCIFIVASFILAQEIAFTSFEEPDTSSNQYVDTGDAATDHAMQNNDNQPLINYQSIGGELGFQSFYYNTRGGVGLTDGDYVGVTNSTNDIGSYSDGSQGFEISDADGYMVTMLDTIDISAYNSVLVTLDYYLLETGWESKDILRIWLLLDGTIELDLLNTEGTDIDNLAIEGSWSSLTQKVIGYQKLNVKFGLDCNAETETLYLDNIRIYDGGYENSPPTIDEYATSSMPPLSDESFSDTIQVYDIDGIVASAMLHYAVNSGDTVDVEMNALSYNSLYTAEISDTAYTDEDQVVYWVSAMDDSGAITIGESHGFFAGITEISIFKQWRDNMELLYEGYNVRTSGVATVGNSVFSNDHMNFYIQDEVPAAVNIFQYDAAEIEIIPGHQYTVVGLITHCGGLVKVMPDNPATDVTNEGEATMPEPIVFDMATLLIGGELLESLLVKVENVDTVSSEDNDPWPPSGVEDSADIMISDDDGTSQLILQINKDTNIPGTIEPTWPQHITGIFSQYDSSSQHTEGYQLIPRSINDFENVTAIGDFANVAILDELDLYPAYPNPFNPSTTIPFNIPASMIGVQVKKLTIYNTLGQVVMEHSLTNLKAGLNTVSWNGRSNEGNPVTSGLYFAVLQLNNLRQTVKLLLLE